MSEPNEETQGESKPASGVESDASTVVEDVDSLPPEEAERAALLAERDRLKDQLLRTAADFDNYRKRARRDVEEAQRRAREDTLRELLPVVDNLERAVQAAEQASDPGAVAEGVRMVLRGFEDVAQKLGLVRVEAVGQRFDPNLHDAVQQAETDEHPVGSVIAELVPGYVLNEKLIRPALVVVAKAKKPSDDA